MQGKRVLLGVTGGIAAYKSPDLVRRLREQGAEVQVVLTSGAREFVTPTTFQAVSGREVRSDLWDPEAEKAMSHIELARWADFVIIAPATADFLARLATGQADDLLTTLCLATDAPIALAPAMNRLMWSNPATQANVATLESRGIHVWGPGEGDQACGEVGAGRMLEPTQLANYVSNSIAPAGQLAVPEKPSKAIDVSDTGRPRSPITIVVRASCPRTTSPSSASTSMRRPCASAAASVNWSSLVLSLKSRLKRASGVSPRVES